MYSMKRIASLLFMVWSVALSWAYTTTEEAFDIYTSNVEVDAFADRTLDMRSKHNLYQVKLIPRSEGNVAFALSEIIFRSTIRVPDLHFRIRVMGYVGGQPVVPVFSVDGNNQDIFIEDTDVIFRHIYGTIPVYFDDVVDSVKLEYSNSHGLNLDQYLRLEDLRVLVQKEIIPNPDMSDLTQGHHIMMAIDGSSSVGKQDRQQIYQCVRHLIGKLDFAEQDSAISILDFGTDINGAFEFRSKRTFQSKLKTFKKRKYASVSVRYTNWSTVFQRALEEKPKTLFIVTDGWSNYYEEQQSNFTAHLNELIDLSNAVKANGTRIVFIGAGLHHTVGSVKLLEKLLDGSDTRSWRAGEYAMPLNVHETDFIALDDFQSLYDIDLSALFIHSPRDER